MKLPPFDLNSVYSCIIFLLRKTKVLFSYLEYRSISWSAVLTIQPVKLPDLVSLSLTLFLALLVYSLLIGLEVFYMLNCSGFSVLKIKKNVYEIISYRHISDSGAPGLNF